MFYLGDNERITSNFVDCHDRSSILTLQRDIRSSEDKFRISNLVISESLLPRKNKRYTILNLDFFDDMQFDIFNKILDSNLSKDEIKYIIKHLSCYEDFVLFANRVAPIIEFKDIYTYNVLQLKKLDELSKSMNVNCESSVILDNHLKSIENAKVLKLLKRYKEI